MKSVIAEAATISKAIEEAWKSAGCPIEFFTKIIEKPKPGFLGFGSKSAVIALFFTKDSIKEDSEKGNKLEVLKQESYSGFFNNKNLKVENSPKQQQKEVQSGIKPQPTSNKSQPSGNKPQQQNQGIHQQRNTAKIESKNIPSQSGLSHSNQKTNQAQKQDKKNDNSQNLNNNSHKNLEKREDRSQKPVNTQQPNNQPQKLHSDRQKGNNHQGNNQQKRPMSQPKSLAQGQQEQVKNNHRNNDQNRNAQNRNGQNMQNQNKNTQRKDQSDSVSDLDLKDNS